MDDQITLAEAMGWKRVTEKPGHPDRHFFFPPNNWKRSGPFTYHENGLPDPFTDANDCDALIRFLKKYKGMFEVRICHRRNYDTVAMFDDDGYQFGYWKGDDYKQGVCKLALKVISDDKYNTSKYGPGHDID